MLQVDTVEWRGGADDNWQFTLPVSVLMASTDLNARMALMRTMHPGCELRVRSEFSVIVYTEIPQ